MTLRTKMSGFIISVVICALLFFGSSAFSEDAQVTVKNGEPWISLSGQLAKINMIAVKGMWEEYALKRDDGETVILVGQKTSELKDMIGKRISIAGALKPRLKYAGNLVRTVEVREITQSPETSLKK